MQRGVVIRRRRAGPGAALAQRLPAVLRPASAGPVRYWQDRSRLAAKGAFAAAAAWALAIGLATGLAVNLLAFPPLQLRPADHAIRHWGDEIAAALTDLATAASTPDSSGRFWARHDRELTAAADRSRVTARQARESLRWNPRAVVPQSVPRPDGVVTDTLDVLTARTRAVARALLDGPDRADPWPVSAAFGQCLARGLRALTEPVSQLADLRSPGPGPELTAARDQQRELERQASDHGSAAERQLARLTGDMIRELAGDDANGERH